MVKPVSSDLHTYLMKSAWDYWATVGLTIASAVIVAGTQDAFPQIYLRYLMGSFFLLVLPGYSLTNSLFPGKIMKSTDPRMDQVYRAAFSVVLSIAVVSVVGLTLDYTPFGVSLSSLVFSLSLLTIFLATIAVLRRYRGLSTTSDSVVSMPTLSE